MAIFVNSNIASLNAQKNLNSSGRTLETSLQRLSSGLRINSARDDAAGMAISASMTANIRSFDQAIRNTNDGISVAQTAEASLKESTSLLQRARELSVQAANASLSSNDRSLIQKEVSQIQSELNAIANNTQFNGVNLLDGSFTSKAFQTGIQAGETVSVTISSATTTDLKNFTVSSGTSNTGSGAGSVTVAASVTANGIAAQTLTVSGSTGSTAVTVGAGADAKTVAASVNSLSGSTGVTAKASTTTTLSGLSADGTLTLTLGSGGSTSVISAAVTTTDLSALRDAINETSGTHEVTATSSAGSITLVQAEGKDVQISNASSNTANSYIDVTSSVLSSTTTSLILSSGQADSVYAAGTVTFNSTSSFTVSSSVANSAGGVMNTAASTAVSSTTAAVSSVDVSTVAGATSALDIIDAALSKIADIRADLGAVQNRFQANVNNLSSVVENLSAARARIQDADFAMESTNFSKSQILQQAGTAMLAQANTSPQLALSLVG